MNTVTIIQWVCSGLLIAITLAFIFSPSFRVDCFKGKGSAKVLGLLSVEGATVVLLCALFLGALLFSISKTSLSKKIDELTSRADTIENQLKSCRNDLQIKIEEVIKLEKECHFVSKKYVRIRIERAHNSYRVGLFHNAAKQYHNISTSLPACFFLDQNQLHILRVTDNAYSAVSKNDAKGWMKVCDNYREILNF